MTVHRLVLLLQPLKNNRQNLQVNQVCLSSYKLHLPSI
uniref:Uncharacterized protein n=1 Tax=Siphoviridae sp. ctsoB6 TaxID=2826487 RepID=A0A8S5QQ45_9CAUD|nr:MAG TPA: hypothetical protein [Siphoviridae sp. ctsoB6]